RHPRHDRRRGRAGPAREGPGGSREGSRPVPGQARQRGIHRKGARTGRRQDQGSPGGGRIRPGANCRGPSGVAYNMREYDEVTAAIEERGFTRMVFDMRKIRELMDVLGSPQRAYPAIHLTGTNGKTSTARMIDALLRAHGLHTGRYTSPHLETVRERIS